MINNQRYLFNLPEHISYLNNASMSPSLKAATLAGYEAIIKKETPYLITTKDFFEDSKTVKQLFSTLISCDDPERIAIIPSVSYGISCVTNNIVLNEGDEIILLENQFPSNVYAWKLLAKRYNAKIVTVKKPNTDTSGKDWNEAIINAINKRTAVVSIPHVHWTDGTLFNLEHIRLVSRINNALLIIDGTQSVGALSFSIERIQPDALICAAYKWLLGPYSTGLAYFGPYFDTGTPIEESWFNRVNSEDFSGLINYNDNYKPKAHRYSVGESAQFINLPMLIVALKQLNEWTPELIQDYAKNLINSKIDSFNELGCIIAAENYRCNHLIGIEIPEHIDINKLNDELKKDHVYLSIRGKYIRLALHLYNTDNDLEKLIKCIKSMS